MRVPVIFAAIYFILYLIAAYLYPGGNDYDKNCIGFSWMHNYWCDLTGDFAKNGQYNDSRNIAIAALFCAALSLGSIWYSLTSILGNDREMQTAKWTGIFSVLFGTTVFTSFHPYSIFLGGFFSFVAITFLLKKLLSQKLLLHYYTGLFTLLFMCVNYYIYTTERGIYWLPVLQKFTFLVVFGWFMSIGFLYRQ